MPIYEYECEDCGDNFEVFLGFKDPPVKECLHCKSSNIRKLVSNCSFQLKGTGWYVTDYARKDAQKDQKKDQKPKSESGKASGSKDSAKTTESKDTSKKSDSGKAA